MAKPHAAARLEAPGAPNSGHVPLETLTKLLMISGERVRQLVKDGFIPKAGKNTYPLVGAVQGYIRFLKDEERRTSKVQAESSLKAAKQREIELKIAERENRLIDIEEAVAVMDEVVGSYRSEFAGIPARVTRDVPLRRKIEAEVNGALKRVSDLLGKRLAALRASGEAVTADAEADA